MCCRFELEVLAADFSIASLLAEKAQSLLGPALVLDAVTSVVADGLAGDAGRLVAALMPKFVISEQDSVVSQLVVGQLVASLPLGLRASEMLCHRKACDRERVAASALALALAFALERVFALALAPLGFAFAFTFPFALALALAAFAFLAGVAIAATV